MNRIATLPARVMTAAVTPPAFAPTSTLARLFAAVFVAGLVYSLAMLLRPDAYFLSRPFIEDAFYSLSVARSLGHGAGMTIDGVTPTNGVQPLICFLYAPAFAAAGDDLHVALRIALALQIVLAGLAALAVARFVVALVPDRDAHPHDGWSRRRRELFWLVAGTISMSYSMLVHLQNGLETSLVTAIVFAAMAYFIERIARRPAAGTADFVRLGALLGVGVLARIDVAILVAAIALWHPLATRGRRTAVAPIVGSAIVAGTALVVSLPWWIYNLVGFGHLMPTSGLAQQDLVVDPLRSLDLVLRGVSNALMVVLHAPGDVDGPIAYVGLIGAAIAALGVAIIRPLRRWFAEAATLVRSELALRDAAPLALFLLVLVGYYALFFGAPHFIPRYLIALWLVIASCVVALAHGLWRVAAAGGWQRPALLGLVAVALGASAWAQSRHFSADGLYTNVMLYPAEWIAANTAPGERIGMFQSGTTGFLFERVTNLDGKVNPNALAALREGRLARFVDSASFDYIIDLDFYTRHIFRDPALRARYEPVVTLPRDFVVWRRRD